MADPLPSSPVNNASATPIKAGAKTSEFLDNWTSKLAILIPIIVSANVAVQCTAIAAFAAVSCCYIISRGMVKASKSV